MGIAALCFYSRFLMDGTGRALGAAPPCGGSAGQTPAGRVFTAMTRSGNSCAQASLPASASTTRDLDDLDMDDDVFAH